MATILRDHGRSGYSAHFDKVPLEQVANSERLFPEALDLFQPDRRYR